MSMLAFYIFISEWEAYRMQCIGVADDQTIHTLYCLYYISCNLCPPVFIGHYGYC